MSQEHHHHHHAPAVDAHSLNRAFVLGIVLNVVFVVTEFIAGFWLDSLSLLSDAGHNMADVVSLVLALLAFRLAKVKPNKHYTYGYKKSTILVSLLNAVILLVAVGGIVMESIHKFSRPTPVEGGAIAWVAGIGVIINGFTAFLFLRDKEKDLNAKGAYMHMAADALVSVGVLVAGIAIVHTGWYIIDPIIGLVVAVVILFATWNLLHDSVRLTLDGIPADIDRQQVVDSMRTVTGVQDVHHIHIWALSTTENALTAHIILKPDGRSEEIKYHIRQELMKLGISHATLELESIEEHDKEEEDDSD
ncbi:MAG: cation diffusion facilitator family transporter [Prevotellaceae bacterium]|jgi:cobalt-zinc-cadmium efflux system protein|nr:cation diffusion facilitator family transporter [Prevotellaceae bacterium]